jgi:hypothetical protein
MKANVKTTSQLGEVAAAAADTAGQIVGHASAVSAAASRTTTAARATDPQASELA